MSMWISAAKMLHRVGVPFPYLNLIACGSSNVLTEIKFEVTERCNLACSFCHQDFGAKGGTATAFKADVTKNAELKAMVDGDLR